MEVSRAQTQSKAYLFP